MARVLLGCYELKNNKVTKLVFADCYKKFKKELFDGVADEGEAYKKWTAIKQLILDGKDKSVRTQDSMTYVIKTLDKDHFVVFGLGNGKKDTLETIYAQAQEDNGEEVAETTQTQESAPVEEAKETGKEVKASTEGSWDLTDVSKTVDEHVNAILGGKYAIAGKFNEEQSNEVLKLLGEGKVAECIKNATYKELPKAIGDNLQKYNKAFNYTVYDKVKIANLIKDLVSEVSKDEFEQNLEAVDAEDFDFNLIKA